MMLQADPHTLKVLDFEKIISLLRRLSVSEPGRSFCQTLKPLTDLSVIKQRLGEVTEMKLLSRTRGLLPLQELRVITPLVNKAKPDEAFLTPKELLCILLLLQCATRVRNIISADKQHFPLLWGISSKIKILEPVEKELFTAIDPEGEILDTSSKELLRIRREIKKLRERVRTVLERIASHEDRAIYMQDQLITIRNERYVIPVKAVFKTRVPGVVHDQSNNFSTYFIEPFEVVESNNELILLMKKEEDEKIIILRRLTAFVRENGQTLRDNEKLLAILDTVQAKAQMSEKMGGREPILVDRSEIQLLRARHPLLLLRPPSPEQDGDLPVFDSAGVVPIDIVFPAQFSAMVITGTNMGGKTAALKTIGLLTLMVQTGMHIPVAEGSHLTVWERIFADIGDEQNLEESVSTFSSHINRLSTIENQANERSLVLLDEIGAGTDPQEGSALALAVIDSLRTRKAKVAVTTHHTLLKAYAAAQTEVLNVSVTFDAESLRPTFTLLYGVPGNSNAFETAARLGLNPSTLSRATRYLHEHDRRILELISNLDTTVRRFTAVKGSLEVLFLSAQRYESLVSRLAGQLEKKQEAIIGETELRARCLFRDAEAQVKKLLKSKSLAGEKSVAGVRKGLTALRGNFREKLGEPKKPAAAFGRLTKGDLVHLGKGNKQGKIVDINYSSQQVEVQLDGMRLKTGINALAQIRSVSDNRAKRDIKEPSKVRLTESSERPESCAPLNLIGFTIDEAIPAIDKAIDNALLYAIQEIRIIHGLGTGRLRQAIHDHLNQQPLIKRFYLGNPFEGGAGITIVEVQS